MVHSWHVLQVIVTVLVIPINAGRGSGMKRYKTGYTQGVYDMFHVGHLNLINNAKKYCEYLIVGVNADQLVQEYKHKTPVVKEEERRKIVANIRAVDYCIIASTLNKIEMHSQLGFDVIFIGDDWKGNARWEETETALNKIGVEVCYLPHTEGICSSDLRIVESEKVND